MPLLLFDMDGTLVDSQAHIVASVGAAFAALDRPAPDRDEILPVVGLALRTALARLAPRADADQLDTMVAAYAERYQQERRAALPPLFPGMRTALDDLAGRDDLLLGVATAASRRGLMAVVEGHGIRGHFVTLHCADDHPSKPDPSMIRAALADTGQAAGETALLGDAVHDMQMAVNAGVRGLGAGWGFVRASGLREAGAEAVLAAPSDLPAWARTAWEGAPHG